MRRHHRTKDLTVNLQPVAHGLRLNGGEVRLPDAFLRGFTPGQKMEM